MKESDWMYSGTWPGVIPGWPGYENTYANEFEYDYH